MADHQAKLQYKWDDCDGWTKVEDAALRKKIQDRLSKRKKRKFQGDRSHHRSISMFIGDRAKQAKQNNGKTKSHPQPQSGPDTQPISNTSGNPGGYTNITLIGRSFPINLAVTRHATNKDTLGDYLAQLGLAEHHYLTLI